MIRYLALIVALLFPSLAHAGVACSVPFNLTNGTTADASQVMANYNAILSCLANNTAASGANSDITSLNGLTTPIPPAAGGTTSFLGATSTGTNTQVVATTTPTGFALTLGYKVRYKAGGANTAATQLQVGATAATDFYRQTPAGPKPMVGGEIVIGQMVDAEYDGTQWQMTSLPALTYPPGAVFDYAGAGGCPVGSLEATGASTVSQTTYPTLFAILGTTWGAAGGGNFTIPDLRGRTTFNRDSGGSGRITVAGGNFDGTVIGGSGGQESKVVNKVNLANFGLNVTDPGHTHAFSAVQSPGLPLNGGGSSGGVAGSTTNSATTGISVTSGGSSTPLPTLSNAAIVLKCVKG